MKRLLFLTLIIGLYHFSVAQVKSPVTTGNATGQKVTANKTFTFNVGSAIPYFYNGGNNHKLQVGFPYNTVYIDQTFADDITVSKGYYPDYIGLKWSVANNASKIENFTISRIKQGETDTVIVDNVDKIVRNWEDFYCEPNTIYEYIVRAIGVPGEDKEYFTFIKGFGFRAPLATVTGRVSFSGGNGVKNVTITASTEDNPPAHSLELAEFSYLKIPQNVAKDFSSGFTFQSYLKFNTLDKAGIFSKDGNFELWYDEETFIFIVGNDSVKLPFEVPTNEFIHISAVYDGDSARIYIPAQTQSGNGQINDSLLQVKAEILNTISPNTNKLDIGNAGNFVFRGKIDEVRIWERALEKEEIVRDYSRYLSGKEDGFFAYLRMNEGFGEWAYDISKKGSYYNENHACFAGANITWSSEIPKIEQLSNRGITDEEGNYLIAGIPFLEGGSPYKFTPMLAPHEFEPGYKILYLSEDAMVHNNINFTDISAFHVDGYVAYRNTNMIVKDVEVLVDGQPVFGNDNKPVKTNEKGEFNIEVPIGSHYISLRKEGHGFENDGRWPVSEEKPDSIIRHDFNQNISFGEPFIDTTLVTVVGRVIGGTGSNQFPFGFGQSVNNIGAGKLELNHSSANPELTYKNTGESLGLDTINYTVATDVSDDGDTIFTEFKQITSRTEYFTTIFTDGETAEFVTKLIPEKFSVVDISINGDTDNEIKNFFGTRIIDLSTNPSLKTEYIYDDNGNKLDSLEYHVKLNYIYQTLPEINVTNTGDSVLFYGEKEIEFKDPETGEDTIVVVEDHFLYPVFLSFADYNPKISVFERYTNYDTDEETYQSIKEAEIEIINDLAIKERVKTYKLVPESNGTVTDDFKVGLPSITKNENEKTSFTKTLQINVTVDGNTYSWEPGGELYRAYIMGQRPKGNNFYTEGPQVPEFILRDPPGSESYAYIEKGSSYAVSSKFETNFDNGSGFSTEILVGTMIEAGGGLAGPVIQSENVNSGEVGLSFSTTVNKSGEYVQTYEFTERVETSADPGVVGSMGDIYMGKSYNYFYGEADNLKILSYNFANNNGLIALNENELKDSKYTLGIVEGYIMNPDNSDTYFKYTQAHILNKLLPEIEDRRNNLFVNSFHSDGDLKYENYITHDDIRYGIAHTYIILTDTAKYVDDIRTIAANGDTVIVGFFKSSDTDSIASYSFRPESQEIDDLNNVLNDTIYEIDSIRYYNSQIGIWIDAIRLNEAEKASAIEQNSLEQNISFDGAVGSITRSHLQTLEYNLEETRTKNLEFTAQGSVGFLFNKTGVITTGELKVEHSIGVGTSENFTQSLEFGYVLSDGNVGDYYSINVLNRTGNGIFDAEDLEETKQDLPSGFNYGIIGQGVSLVGGIIAVGTSSAYNAGGGIPLVAGAATMSLAAGLSYKPYNKFQDEVDEEGDRFEPGDIRVSSFDISSPMFSTLGGATMCPFQDMEHTFFYKDEQGDSVVLHKATLQREKPEVTAEPAEVFNIPMGEPAIFNLKLSNNSESGDNQWYALDVDESTNTKGALVLIDGEFSQKVIHIPANTTITKIVTIEPTNTSEMDYENIGLIMHSICQFDPTDFMPEIADTVLISAHFQPACTSAELLEPLDNWVVNVQDKDTMTVRIGEYNLSHETFESFRFEYKASSGNIWIPVKYFVNDPALANKDETPDTLLINDQPSITFDWSMVNLKDRGYDIRVVSVCTDGSINESTILSGILDGQRPQVFGTPQPADGILNIDENISILFNEPIEGGLLNNFNFDVKGTLNYFELKHEAYIRMNGSGDFATIPEGISFNNKSFTIEFWMRPDLYSNAVILSHGDNTDTNLEIGLRDGNKTYFKLGSVEYEAPLRFSSTVPATAWQHMAYVFDYENKDMFVYQNDSIRLEAKGVTLTYNNTGKIDIGRSANPDSNHFAGSLHELRIWSKSLSLGDVYANQYVAMSGNEVGLYGYWPIDEAFGEFAIDKAANRHMNVFAPWETYPGGSSWNFAGGNALSFYSGYFAIIPEMDYTMEFWFKDSTPSDTLCLFSNQKGDGTEGDNLMDKALSIMVTPNGKIWVVSKGNWFEAVTNNYFNDSWHHFALIVRRRGNAIALIDGEPQNEKENTVLGGIAGANMVLGARVWNNPTGGSGEDKYYTGKLDEFRLWNLAKTQTQIKLDMNSKLNGNEIGLMAYFPFEGFYADALGVMAQDPTLENFDDDINSADAIAAVGEAFTTDAPDMKDVRPVQSIAYDYVASEDQIMINPKSYLFPQLEKNIIEITVEGVEDKYGNPMASPATWTAYVHRNQVRWEDERRLFTKEIYKTMEFVSTIKNTGGKQVGFSITNLPPWLSVLPSSGTINPESTLDIVFTINPALNIGEYNEDIVLHTENGFDEKLPITVRVFKTPPNWNVDPSKFESTMNIVGRVKIDGILSTDIFDKVAAFVNDTLQGVANVRYVKDFDSYLVFLNVYGDSTENANKARIEFRIWDASAGQILDNIIPDAISFEYEKIVGSTRDPITFEATGLFWQHVPVSKGWNWVSFNKLSKKRNNLNQFFSALEPALNDQIKSSDRFVSYTATGWDFGNLDSIDYRWMYQIKMSNADTVIYSGEALIPEDNPIPLGNGWNHIGYLPDLTMDVSDALRYYTPMEGDVIKSQFAFSMYDERAGWLGNLNVMQPSLGYKFKTQKIDTLVYPNSTVYKSTVLQTFTSPPSGWNSNYKQYQNSMSVVAKLDLVNTPGLTMNDQMVLGAFVDDVCRGFVSPNMSKAVAYFPFFLNVSGEGNGKLVKFKLFDGSTGGLHKIREIKPFINDAVIGRINEPLVLTISDLETGGGELDYESFLRCYPNPFNEQINIEFAGNKNKINIDVVNATGSLVKSIYNAYPLTGINTCIWDGTNGKGAQVTSGIYYIRFVSGNTVETVKISKTR